MQKHFNSHLQGISHLSSLQNRRLDLDLNLPFLFESGGGLQVTVMPNGKIPLHLRFFLEEALRFGTNLVWCLELFIIPCTLIKAIKSSIQRKATLNPDTASPVLHWDGVLLVTGCVFYKFSCTIFLETVTYVFYSLKQASLLPPSTEAQA